MQLAKFCLSLLSRVIFTIIDRPLLLKMIFNAIRLRRPEIERFRSERAFQFLSFAFCNRQRSQSQILQDLWVLFELDQKVDGFFVEFGATDGRTNSNTWLLEQQYGWTGILAEPNPYWHAALKANRSASIDTRCVSSTTGQTVTLVATDNTDPELSGIADYSAGEHFESARACGRKIIVETISLDDLLSQHGAKPDIDYLSVDTEGSELAILSNFNFAKYKISLISVEQNGNTGPQIEALLKPLGFERVFQEFSQWDAWYVNPAVLSNAKRRRTGGCSTQVPRVPVDGHSAMTL